MRRLLMVSTVAALMAAMMVAMAAPAMARDFDFDRDHGHNDFDRGVFFNDNNDGFLTSDVDQESESGDVSIGFDVSNTGDYASQCTPAIQQGNTGNFNNAPSFVQFGSGFDDNGFNDFDHNFGFFGNDGFFNTGGIDDFEPEGIDVTFAPQQAVDCSSTIQQSSAADSSGYYWGY